jgi:hypothetical protein
MRVYEMVRHRRARVVVVVTLAVIVALVAFASTAGAAAPTGVPLRNWSVSKILQGPGRVEVSSGAQTDGALDQTVDTGRVAFNLPRSRRAARQPTWTSTRRTSRPRTRRR